MSSRYPLFNRDRLSVAPLQERCHDLDLSIIKELNPVDSIAPGLRLAARAIVEARRNNAAVIFMMGAHLIRSGVQKYLIDLMERNLISGLAGNGACAIHDFELARIGATTESVARYIQNGQFGLWAELDEMNRAFSQGAKAGWGAGETLGRLISSGDDFPYRNISLFAASWRLAVPFTVHIGIGCDIIHELPACDGAALGKTSYVDFLVLARQMENLENGFWGNFGSAVIGPEVYLKALSMARNVARRPYGGPRKFTTLVCDLHSLPDDTRKEAAKSDAVYYFRPWKTILARTVADGGTGYYVQERHESSIPALWTAIGDLERAGA